MEIPSSTKPYFSSALPGVQFKKKVTSLFPYIAISVLLHVLPVLALPYFSSVFSIQEPEEIRFSVKMQQQAKQVLFSSSVSVPAKAVALREAGVSPVDLDGEIEVKKASYEMLLAARIEKFRFYPRIAQKLGKQGTSVVRLELDSNGKLLDVRIERSSGEEILDAAALDIIARAQPFPKPPDDYLELLNRRGDTSFVFRAPIGFDLKSLN